MELRDRVEIRDGHFHVLAEDTERKLYYGCIYFRDSHEMIPQVEPIEYWDSLNANEITPESLGCFLYLEERKDDEVVDQCKVFMPPARKGGILRIILDRPFRYGKNACRITISWENCPAEAIHGDYIWLEDTNNHQYPFLVDHIQPLESKKNEVKDQYIFTIPEDMHMGDFHVVFDPAIHEKYKVIY